MRKDKRTEESITTRIRHDKEVFKIVKCDYVVDANKNLGEVVELVKYIINLK
jgi:guanylate kinase